jgi:DNA-binding transcriptional regulator YiaG
MKYQSKQLGVIHESAKDLFDAGLLSVAEMREFDAGCLAPSPSSHSKSPSVGSNSRSAAPIPAVAAPRA